jgi:hypothetical protein
MVMEIAVGPCETATSQPACALLMGCLWGSQSVGAVDEVQPPLSECLSLSPEEELDFGSTSGERSIDIDSDCPMEVRLRASLRAGSGDFSLGPETVDLTLAAQDFGSIPVRFTPMAPGPAEEILVIEILSPEPGYRPITLRGTGP